MDQPQFSNTNTSKDRTFEEDNFESIEIDSDLLLSKIEFDQALPESPQINYNTAEAKIKELTETAEPNITKRSKPYCGCGQTYSCTSSLYLHIRSKHGGIPPVNTIGGPKGIVKKPNNFPDPAVKLQEDPNSNYTKYPHTQQNAKNPSQSQIKQQAKQFPQTSSNPPTTDSSQKPSQQNKKPCKFCPKRYSCNSSLNLHLKRKHLIRTTSDGRIQVSDKQEDKTPQGFVCSMCGLNYASKSALGLHYNNKHSSKIHLEQGFPYDQNKIQKCGCGLVYQSRSALNMHVKKKHGGINPEGTTPKPNMRAQSYHREERHNVNTIENYLTHNKSNEEDEDQHSIFDSNSDGKILDINKEKISSSDNNYKSPNIDNNKIFLCGCGRNYSCSSALNLHIKKNHNRIVPKGTVGGPRGIRTEEEPKQLPKLREELPIPKFENCSKCQIQLKTSYFICKKCSNHQLCSNCFWENPTFTEEHEWQCKDNNP